MNVLTLAADMTALLHLGIAVFLVGGFVFVWIGHLRGWKWITHRKFRFIHLLLMAFVTLESVIGLTCPLTALEDWLRHGSLTPGDVRASFVRRLVHQILFYDIDLRVFTVIYILFMAAVLFTWHWVPPASSRKPDPEFCQNHE